MCYAHSTRAVFANMLSTLDHLVSMAQRGDIPDDILAKKLTDDMFPLELQFRVAINQVLLAVNQVGGIEVPLDEATYQSLAHVRERIETVGSYIDKISCDNWADSESIVDLTLPNGVRFIMSAEEYIRDWILPNFYFHTTMSYALLRHAGLSIGKMDFLPHMRRYVARPKD